MPGTAYSEPQRNGAQGAQGRDSTVVRTDGCRGFAVADYPLEVLCGDGKEAPLRMGRREQIRDVRETLSKHSSLCSKPFMRQPGQNLVRMARTGLILAFPGLYLHSGFLAITGSSMTRCV